MLQHFYKLCQYTIIVILTIQVGYLLFFSIAAKLIKKAIIIKATKFRRIRVFIPGYKEDAVIIETARNALLQNYPKDLFEVIIIADSFSEATLNTLRSMPVRIIEVSFENSSKGKALHRAALITASQPVDIAIIIDADNHMGPGFLIGINDAFEHGHRVVQAHRTAKNLQTPLAYLDACTEEINNHIFRKGHVAVGLPAALIGSGMGFKWDIYVAMLENIGDTSGEDKEFEIRLLRNKEHIAFLEGLYIFDEKVSNSAVFVKQRSRWLAIQLEFFKKNILEGWQQLFKGNFAFFNKVFQTCLIPRIILLAIILLWLVIVIFFLPNFFLVSFALFIALALALLLGIPYKWYNKQLLFALLQIPVALFSMLKALSLMGKANKQFIHTPHGETTNK